MAKINSIKVDGVTRYIETIAYKDSLPTATSDSADLVSVDNKIYVKNYTTTQGVSGIWQFKDDPTTNLTVAKNITFTTTSDGATIYTQIIGGSSDMWYDDTYVYDSADWTNADYKTIAIIGGADIEDSELESFLSTNATYLGRAYYYTQDTLVSGSNIKTINNETILGSGNIEIECEAPITAVDTLPEANKGNFEEGKIYSTGALLHYISKEVVDTPSIEQVNSFSTTLQYTSASAVGNDIYIFGGWGVNTIHKYNPTTNTISTMSATLPMALYGTSAATVGTDIYIFGGRESNTYVKTIYKYDTTTDTIITMSATLPYVMCETSAVAVGSDIYVFGGNSLGYPTNLIHKYSTTTNTLRTQSTNLPVTLYGTSAAVVGTDIYIFGGYDGDGRVNTIHKYNATTNTISTMSAILPQALESTSAATVGSDIYIFGGNSAGGTAGNVNTIYKYNPTTNTISTMSAILPVALRDTSAVAIGTDVYIFGGNNGSNGVNTIYQFSLGFTYQYEKVATEKDLENKQNLLESGANVKTINGESILGSGNIEVAGDTTYVENGTLIINEGTTTGGGTEVVANNGETTTNTLSSLKVGEINYAVPSGGLTEEEVQTLINNAIGTTLQGGY